MSDEDKRDRELLLSIQSKIDKRINAALTPEEKAVMQKYGLSVVPIEKGNRTLVGPRGPIISEWRSERREIANNPNMNFIDSYRKRAKRGPQRAWMKPGDYMTTDTTPYHDSRQYDLQQKWDRQKRYSNKFQLALNSHMQQPYLQMKYALDDRNKIKKELDSLDDKYAADVKRREERHERQKAQEERIHQEILQKLASRLEADKQDYAKKYADASSRVNRLKRR